MTKLTIFLEAETLLTVVARAAELGAVKVSGSSRCWSVHTRLQNPEPLVVALGAVRLLGIQVRTMTKGDFSGAGFSTREGNVRRHDEVAACKTGRRESRLANGDTLHLHAIPQAIGTQQERAA